jgi:uncharacterized damage-inducible protein DinB
MSFDPAPDYILSMARYNRWMNESLWTVCAALPDEARKADVGGSFRSIHGLLNHMLLGDRLWLGRFTGVPYQVPSLTQELYADFDELRRERAVTDDAIDRWAAETAALSPEELTRTLWFHSVALNRRCGISWWHAIMQFFNHQTHHRGQLTSLLHQAGCDFGLVDILWAPGIEIAASDPPAN